MLAPLLHGTCPLEVHALGTLKDASSSRQLLGIHNVFSAQRQRFRISDRKEISIQKEDGWLLLILALAGIGAALYFAYNPGNMLLSIWDALSYVAATSSDGALREEAKKT